MNIQTSPSPTRILLLGSEGEHLDNLAGKFPEGSIVGRAGSPTRALDLLESRRPQLVIIDSQPGEFAAHHAFALGLRDRSDAAFLILLPEGPTPEGAPVQCLHKPLLDAELAMAVRMVMYCKARDAEAQRAEQRLRELERELAEAGQRLAAISGLLSLCTYCHHVRNESGKWEALHHYLSRRAGVAFSHGVCECCRDEQLAESAPR